MVVCRPRTKTDGDTSSEARQRAKEKAMTPFQREELAFRRALKLSTFVHLTIHTDSQINITCLLWFVSVCCVIR
jgi:hypothetical protein